MVSVRRLFLVWIITFASCSSIAQQDTGMELKGIEIYSEFTDKGYTTAGAYTHFNDLEANNIEKINVKLSDLQELRKAIENCTKSKHRQTKFGGGLIFALFHYAGTDNKDRVVFNIGSESVYVVNLSTMEEYEITNIPDVLWIKKFREQFQ